VEAKETQPVAPRPQRISGRGFHRTADAATATAPEITLPGARAALAAAFLMSVV
jgi:hypothetical protein